MVAVSAAHAIRVLSIDDHPLLREGVATIIGAQADMCVVGQAATGHDGIREYHEKKPDITIMDIRLPDMNGIDALLAIRSEAPNARIIMLSMFRGDVEIRRALMAGARGFLLKTVPPPEIVVSIRRVHAGKKCIPAEVASEIADYFTEDWLTPREVETLGLVGAGNRNRDIGDILSISEDTVKVHVKHIMQKLGAADRTEAVVIAARRGIIVL